MTELEKQLAEALRFYADGDNVVYLSGRIDWIAERKRLTDLGYRCTAEGYNGGEEWTEDGRTAQQALAAYAAAQSAEIDAEWADQQREALGFPKQSAPSVALTDEQIDKQANDLWMRWNYLPVRTFAWNVIAEFCRVNGIALSAEKSNHL